jgi:hypothetical protein
MHCILISLQEGTFSSTVLDEKKLLHRHVSSNALELMQARKPQYPGDIEFSFLRSEDMYYMTLNHSLPSSVDVKNVWYIIPHSLKMTWLTA